jgi:hypothetical protein
MGLASQGLTPSEKALYARMAGKSPQQVEELRRQVMETHIAANPQLVKDIAADIRTKILNDPLLKKDAGMVP